MSSPISANSQIDFTKPIDLQNLLNLDDWKKEEIKKLLHIITYYKADPFRMNLRDIYKKYFPSRTTISCGKIFKEFKEAAENELEFDDYIKDRKFRRDGKKVLAGKKK